MPMPGLEVLVPMKPMATAKSRLAPLVMDSHRQAVALLMLHRVLAAVGGSVGAEACQVVGGDAVVQQVAAHHGVRWRPEPGHDLNSSLWLAMQTAYQNNAQATLFLPADLPEATPMDVRAVVAASRGLTIPVGVRARNDGGTNALLMPTAYALPPALGEASYARHAAEVQACGVELHEAGAPGLAFDVDTPADLTLAEAHLDGFTADLGRWVRWLGERALAILPTQSTAVQRGDHG